MSKKLVDLPNPELVTKTSRNYLIKNKWVPGDCPKPDCLKTTTLRVNYRQDADTTIIILAAKPPELPSIIPRLPFARHPICITCSIDGNSNICFRIIQKGDLEPMVDVPYLKDML